MSNEFDPQYAHPQGSAPARIVWTSDAPAATPAWRGPDAFSTEPVKDESEQQAPASSSSLSSAWASSSSSDSAGAASDKSAPDASSDQDQDRPVAPVWGSQADPVAQEPAPDTDRRPDDQRAQEPWVQPGSADTAEEVHRDWTDRNDGPPQDRQQEQQPQQQPRQDQPQQEQPQQEQGGLPATGPDSGPWAAEPVDLYPMAPSAPAAQQRSGAYDPYARPREDAAQQQDPQGAQDAWAAHQASHTDEPLAEDPSQGDAIPAPPQTDAGSGSGAQQSSDDDALTIGRGRDNSIVLDDMLVSRKHIRITADDQGLLLEDLGSRNGTYVNGQRVDRTHLQEGDRIGVGATTFEVRDGWLVTI